MPWSYFDTRDAMDSCVTGWEWVEHELNWTGPGWYFNSSGNTWIPALDYLGHLSDTLRNAVSDIRDAQQRIELGSPKPTNKD